MNNPAHNANRDLRKSAETIVQTLKPGPIAIAVSGGCDSMAALNLISHANSQNRDIYCFTVDHQLRDEAKLEAQFVADFCASRNIKHRTLIWDGDKPSTGIQNAARWARYDLLSKACNQVGAVGLVTGHNLDDQIETVIMRTLRDNTGKGMGLSGMASAALFFNCMWVLRPFLGARKQALKDYLSSESIDWVEDPSNHNETFERVRIRNQVDQSIKVDEIEKYGRTRKTLNALAAGYIGKHCSTDNGLVFELNVVDVEKRTLEKVLETLVHVVGGRDRSLGRADVEALYNFATAKDNKRMTMGRVVLSKSGQQLLIYRENRGFSEQTIRASEEIRWDGRFLIKNTEAEMDIIIRQDGDQDGCPPLVRISEDEEWVPAQKCGFVRIRPIINKYDQVLSEFDFELANSVAKLLGRSAYCLPFDNSKMQIQQD